MSITTLTPVAPPVGPGTPGGGVTEPAGTALAPVVALTHRQRHRRGHQGRRPTGPAVAPQPRFPAEPSGEAIEESLSNLGEAGAASAEYAAVTACGVGLAGVLLKLLSSDFGQNLLKTLIEFFLKMVGIG